MVWIYRKLGAEKFKNQSMIADSIYQAVITMNLPVSYRHENVSTSQAE